MSAPSQQSSPQGSRTPAQLSQASSNAKVFYGSSKISDYEVLKKLGEGTFGEVHRARRKTTGEIVALKRILMHNEKDGFPITSLREIKVLKLLNHRNILKLEEMSIEHPAKADQKRKRATMYMVTPYMDHDLAGLLENPSVKFTEAQIKCYLLQLLEGMRYMHDNNILHRDMKAANILINNKGILQIADFGLARHYDEPVPVAGKGGGEARRDYTSLVVTRWYRPPELLMHLRRYTTAIDIWGIGCVFGEMLVGRPILAGESDTRQLEMIFDLVGTPTDQNMPGWRNLPGAEGLRFEPRASRLATKFREYGSGACSLLEELLKLDWKKRINAIDALQHSYFRNDPLPLQPGQIPVFEESHELDRKKFRTQRAAQPPAPKGGDVGMGSQGGSWAPDDHSNFGTSMRYNGHRGPSRGYPSGPPGPPRSQGFHDHRNGGHSGRRPAWAAESRPNTSLPPKPPVGPPMLDGGRSDLSDSYRGDRRHGGSGGGRYPPPVDTYVPEYQSNGRAPHRDTHRDDYRRRDDRDRDGGRHYDRMDYGSSRDGRTRSRSPPRDKYRHRDRDSQDRNDVYRR